MTLFGLYTVEGTDGGGPYRSDEPVEYVDGTGLCEKLRKAATLGGGARGPVELLLRPWRPTRGTFGGSAASATGVSN